MNTLAAKRFLLSAALLAASSIHAAENPFLGRWALTIPGGGAGWLGIAETNGQLQGSILWGGGSVVPVSSTRVEGDPAAPAEADGDHLGGHAEGGDQVQGPAERGPVRLVGKARRPFRAL